MLQLLSRLATSPSVCHEPFPKRAVKQLFYITNKPAKAADESSVAHDHPVERNSAAAVHNKEKKTISMIKLSTDNHLHLRSGNTSLLGGQDGRPKYRSMLRVHGVCVRVCVC